MIWRNIWLLVKLSILASGVIIILFVSWFFMVEGANNIEKKIGPIINAGIDWMKERNYPVATPHLILVNANGSIEEKAGKPFQEKYRQQLVYIMSRMGLELSSFVDSYKYISILGDPGKDFDGLKTNTYQIVFSDRTPKVSVVGSAVHLKWPTQHVIKIYSTLVISVSPEDFFIGAPGSSFSVLIFDSKDIFRQRVIGPDALKDEEKPKSKRL